MRIGDHLYSLCRWGVGGLFIYAGSTKLLEPAVFAALIDAFGIIPESILMPVALALPLLEVAAGTALLFDIEGGLAMTTGLIALFSPIRMP